MHIYIINRGPVTLSLCHQTLHHSRTHALYDTSRLKLKKMMMKVSLLKLKFGKIFFYSENTPVSIVNLI